VQIGLIGGDGYVVPRVVGIIQGIGSGVEHHAVQFVPVGDANVFFLFADYPERAQDV
jgi:hypothetical protein